MSFKKMIINLSLVASSLFYSFSVFAIPATELVCRDSEIDSEVTTTFYLFERPFDGQSLLFDSGFSSSMIARIETCEQVQREHFKDVFCEGHIVDFKTKKVLSPLEIVLMVSNSGEEGKGRIGNDLTGTKDVFCKKR